LLVREEIMGRKLNLNQKPPKNPQIYGYSCRRSKKHLIRRSKAQQHPPEGKRETRD